MTRPCRIGAGSRLSPCRSGGPRSCASPVAGSPPRGVASWSAATPGTGGGAPVAAGRVAEPSGRRPLRGALRRGPSLRLAFRRGPLLRRAFRRGPLLRRAFRRGPSLRGAFRWRGVSLAGRFVGGRFEAALAVGRLVRRLVAACGPAPYASRLSGSGRRGPWRSSEPSSSSCARWRPSASWVPAGSTFAGRRLLLRGALGRRPFGARPLRGFPGGAFGRHCRSLAGQVAEFGESCHVGCFGGGISTLHVWRASRTRRQRRRVHARVRSPDGGPRSRRGTLRPARPIR